MKKISAIVRLMPALLWYIIVREAFGPIPEREFPIIVTDANVPFVCRARQTVLGGVGAYPLINTARYNIS